MAPKKNTMTFLFQLCVHVNDHIWVVLGPDVNYFLNDKSVKENSTQPHPSSPHIQAAAFMLLPLVLLEGAS